MKMFKRHNFDIESALHYSGEKGEGLPTPDRNFKEEDNNTLNR
jgi:hypothetical protein